MLPPLLLLLSLLMVLMMLVDGLVALEIVVGRGREEGNATRNMEERRKERNKRVKVMR
mgnify:CR=1 FL=1